MVTTVNKIQSLNKDEFNRVLSSSIVSQAYMYYHDRCLGSVGCIRGVSVQLSWLIRIDWATWCTLGEPSIEGVPLDRYSYGFLMERPPKFIESKLPPQDNVNAMKSHLRKVKMLKLDEIEYLVRTYGLCGSDHIVLGRTDTLIGMNYETAYNMYCKDLVRYKLNTDLYSSTAGSEQSFKYSISRAMASIEDACYLRERQKIRKLRVASRQVSGYQKTSDLKKLRSATKQSNQVSNIIDKAAATTAKISEEVKRVASERSISGAALQY